MMKNWMLHMVFLLLAVPTFGQLDSSGIFRNIELAKKTSDPVAAINYLEEALEAADSLHIVEGQINARLLQAPMLLEQNDQFEGLRTYLQLINLLEKHTRFKTMFLVYKNLSVYYDDNNLTNNSADYLKRGIDLALKEELNIDYLEDYMSLADLYFSSSNLEQSLLFFQKSDSIAVQQNKSKESLIIKRKIVKIQEAENNYEQALTSNLEILELLKKSGNTKDITAQLNNIGYNYKKLDNSVKALQFFKETLNTREENGFSDRSHITLLMNIAITLQNLNRQGESLNYLKRSLEAINENQSPQTAIKILDLTSWAYLAQAAPYDALQHNKHGLKIAKKNNLIESKRDLYLTASVIYEQLIEFDEALKAYKKYLQLNDSIALYETLTEQQLLQQQIAVERTEKEIQGLIASNDIKDYQLEQLKLESENKDIQLENQQLAAKEKLQALKINQQELERQNTEKELQAVMAKEENQRLLLIQKDLEEQKKQQEIDLLETKTKVQDLEIKQRKVANQSMFLFSLLALIIMIMAIFAFFKIRKSNKVINFEKAKSDKLLLNILPESTANELKTMGRSLPRQYSAVSVLFTDFKGFTQITENMHPENLVESLDDFFAGFDDIMLKHGIEKIKTIGDAYMCACGVPEPMADHGLVMVRAAREMLLLSNEINRQKRERNLPQWDLRIGINSGNVVAGVIGKNKFQYDIWGDTVNLASRMESSGVPNKINISESTYQLVKEEINCTHRGEIEAKNKGRIKMYFVEE